MVTKRIKGIQFELKRWISDYHLFNSYIRFHTSLEGKASSEMAGIKIEGENKWITLIQNASKDVLIQK